LFDWINKLKGENMKKIINPGKININGRLYDVFCRVEIKDGKLSISDVEGPFKSGNCKGSCGQILMGYRRRNPEQEDKRYGYKTDIAEFSNGWNREKWFDFLDIWDDWHLNDMRAGTIRQTAFLKYQKRAGWQYDYTEACEKLKRAGLYEDKGYKYGHGWLKEDLPKKVVDFLMALPETETAPAWV
jgi:hypothetical protein